MTREIIITFVEILTFLIFIEKKLKRSFIINGVLQYFGKTSCHYQASLKKKQKKIAFKAPNEIGKLFPFKENIKEKHAQSSIV